VILLSLLLITATASAQEVGKVTRLKGQADVTRSGQTLGLHTGDAIETQDVVRTKRASALDVAMIDGSNLTLGESTRLEVAQYTTDTQPEGLISVTRGRLRALVSKTFSSRSESFKVRTPTAVAGVQGTDFLVLAEALQTRLFLYEGVLSAINVDPSVHGKVILHPGQSTQIKLDRPPETPTSSAEPTSQGPAPGSGSRQDLQSGGSQIDDPGQLTPGSGGGAVLPPIPNLP